MYTCYYNHGFVFFITCVFMVIVLHSLYRAAVSALFRLVVLLIICIVKLHVLRFTSEQIKKEGRKEGFCGSNKLLYNVI